MPEDVFTAGGPAVLREVGRRIECDVAIVGAGVGGATLAWALRDSGARVLVLERGDFLPHEWQNWSAREVLELRRYANSERWLDVDGRSFVPAVYHYVGGASKVFGAAMFRFREADFGQVQTRDGISPAWPITYADMEPFYARAEELYLVHGDGSDPAGPWRSSSYPFPAIPHEPAVAEVARRLERQGLRPFSVPVALDRRDGGRCVLCSTCEAYPCLLDGKGDADVRAMRPALRSPTVRLLPGAHVQTVRTTVDGSRVAGLDVRCGDRNVSVSASRFVIAAGAAHTAVLMLRSRSSSHPDGIANSSAQVGRNYMTHTATFILAVRPGRDQQRVYEKTLGINDWYHAGPTNEHPLGNVQLMSRVQGSMIKAGPFRSVPRGVLDCLTRRSIGVFAQTEDLPMPENRVLVDESGRIQLLRRPTNVEPHDELVARTRRVLRRCGYPLVFARRAGMRSTGHQCGTAAMGTDAGSSVVDEHCRSHDVENLWIVDASVLPSSAAVNPALTVAANALRVAHGGTLTS